MGPMYVNLLKYDFNQLSIFSVLLVVPLLKEEINVHVNLFENGHFIHIRCYFEVDVAERYEDEGAVISFIIK